MIDSILPKAHHAVISDTREASMILRLWRGWTDPDLSVAYEDLLTGQIAPAIMARGVPGLQDLTVLRRHPSELDPARGGEVMTAMTFTHMDAVAAFTGGDPHTSRSDVRLVGKECSFR